VVEGRALWNCNRPAAANIIAASIFQLPAPGEALGGALIGTSDVSLLAGQARRHWARGSWQSLVASGGGGV
jgi:hypothetical protein